VTALLALARTLGVDLRLGDRVQLERRAEVTADVLEPFTVSTGSLSLS
jgi:hypothetical protein